MKNSIILKLTNSLFLFFVLFQLDAQIIKDTSFWNTGAGLYFVDPISNNELKLIGQYGDSNQPYILTIDSNLNFVNTQNINVDTHRHVNGIKVKKQKDSYIVSSTARIQYTDSKCGKLTSLDFSLFKIDAKNNIEWSKTYGTKQGEMCSGLLKSADKGYLLFGHKIYFGRPNCTTKTLDSTNILIIKTDSLGNKLWEKEFFGETLNYSIAATHISQDSILLVTDKELTILNSKGMTLNQRPHNLHPSLTKTGVTRIDDNRFLFYSSSGSLVIIDKSLTVLESLKCGSDCFAHLINGSLVFISYNQWEDDNYGSGYEITYFNFYDLSNKSLHQERIRGTKFTRSAVTLNSSSFYVINESHNIMKIDQTKFENVTSAYKYNQTQVKYHPNPTSGEVIIEFPDNNEDVIIKQRNYLGQILSAKRYIKTDRVEFKLEGINGLYFLEICPKHEPSYIIRVVKI